MQKKAMTYESKRKSVFENDVLKYKVEIVLKYKFKSAAKFKTMTKVTIWLQITRWFYCMDIEYVVSYEYQTLKQTQVIRLVSSKSFLNWKKKIKIMYINYFKWAQSSSKISKSLQCTFGLNNLSKYYLFFSFGVLFKNSFIIIKF